MTWSSVQGSTMDFLPGSPFPSASTRCTWLVSYSYHLILQVCSHQSDWSRHYCLSARPAWPWPRTAQWHARSCRHDRQSRSLWYTSDCRHGYRLWRWGSIPSTTPFYPANVDRRAQYDHFSSPAIHPSQRRWLPHRRPSPYQAMRSSRRQESSHQRHLPVSHPRRQIRNR